ncbi:M23 family metallopeptidase [Albibacterium profundi]|uniref:M23 family metallopeptidase n=1 Tax=Albibacterium profundi TaxID=3134906 RepID=A0ABV5CDW4_9SPHI
MAKTKFYYNSHTLKYEKVKVSLWTKILRLTGVLSCGLLFACILLFLGFTYLDSPKEKQLKRELNKLTLQYEVMQNKMDQANAVLKDLQERDANIYRVIFEADPISPDIRNAGFGGIDRYENLKNYNNSELMIKSSAQLDQLASSLYVQAKSFKELETLAESKSEMLASIPAIQPLNGKNLKRGISGFGSRIHPIYKIRKMHSGIDFSAPIGTPVYATGNGKIIKVSSDHGYGRHIEIDHGFGYKTLYAHLSKFAVKKGKKVKRGDLIGYVGNTGASTGPHLHYEVLKNNRSVNPVNFFYNDLTPGEYAEMLKVASQVNQSFD